MPTPLPFLPRLKNKAGRALFSGCCLPLRTTAACVLLLASQASFATVQSRASASQPLQTLVDREHAAEASGDAAAMIDACRGVVAEALAQLAAIRAASGDRADSIQLYKSSLAAEPASRAQLDLAAELIASGDVDSGKSLASEISQGEPNNARARSLSLGSLAAETHAGTGAEPASSLAAEGRLRRTLATAYNDWGTAVTRQQGDYQGAFLLFQAANHWDPTVPGAVRNLGLAAFRLGKFEDSADAFRSVVEATPGDAQAHVLLGLSLFSLKQFPQAAEAFAPAAGAAMQDSHAAYAWAFSLAHIPEPQKANAILDQLSERKLPPEELALVCQVYDQTENYEHAVACLRKASAEDPALAKVHFSIGVSLIHLSRPAEALPELRRQLALTPDDPDVQFAYAYALIATSQKAEAQTVLASVVQEQPAHGQAQYELGKLLAEQGDWKNAIAHLESAARAEPDKYDIHYQLQNAYRKDGQPAEAARELAIYKAIKANAPQK